VVSLGIFFVVPSDKTMCPEVDFASENELFLVLAVFYKISNSKCLVFEMFILLKVT